MLWPLTAISPCSEVLHPWALILWPLAAVTLCSGVLCPLVLMLWPLAAVASRSEVLRPWALMLWPFTAVASRSGVPRPWALVLSRSGVLRPWGADFCSSSRCHRRSFLFPSHLNFHCPSLALFGQPLLLTLARRCAANCVFRLPCWSLEPATLIKPILLTLSSVQQGLATLVPLFALGLVDLPLCTFAVVVVHVLCHSWPLAPTFNF